jgi:hypothetical protein
MWRRLVVTLVGTGAWSYTSLAVVFIFMGRARSLVINMWRRLVTFPSSQHVAEAGRQLAKEHGYNSRENTIPTQIFTPGGGTATR